MPLGERSFFDVLTNELPAESINSIDTIYNSVVDLTRPDGVDYFSYIENLTSNPIAFRVKLADMMQNISDNPSKRQLEKYAKTKNLLVDKFNDKPPPGISAAHWKSFKGTIKNATKK